MNYSRMAVCGLLMTAMVGCSSVGDLFSHENAIHVAQKKNAEPSDPLTKYSASIRVAGYVDERKVTNPRKIGVGAQMVTGLSGQDILLDQDVTDLVSLSIRNRFDELGYQIVDSNVALFELSGSIKELSYDVKARDEVHIAIETTVREMASGKVLWSALVKEKADRFAGVSGNSKKDVAGYLTQELGIVVQKTVDAISASLIAVRPELFNLTPGTKPVSGVTVYVAPNVGGAPVALPRTDDKTLSGENGTLIVTTTPDRAKVYVDGVYFGLSPLHVEMTPGVRSVIAKSEGYHPASEKVSIRKGDSTELELVLEH